ncbi:putative F-box/FBD/LRR-repeat protein At2g05300 [Hevea brasiliensis]|uniref:putative F-box/FBD/LRR-repeat protein At2g05300 n=1 Tax=Hevea brasiliensis TaxID=3981 RepID=UPI0025DCAE1D|nr:putative F-box/FBD/LRR-repeat protein At2g05300 [Hevea brasiliensis]
MQQGNEPKRTRVDNSIVSSTMGTVDRLSQLPEITILRILFLLSARDAARTSLLSKAWWRLWSSLPTENFEFRYSSFPQNCVPEEGENMGNEEILDKFIKFVDDSLFRIRGDKIKIESFLLHLPYCESKLQSHMDEWIELITKNPVKEFEIYSDRCHAHSEWYVLPRTISVAKSLSALNLQGLKLDETTFLGHSKFPCLRNLSLSKVHLSRTTAEKLLSSCPLLEQFVLRSCLGFSHLCIPNLPKLKKVEVYYLDGIVIEASNLEILDCTILSGNLEPGALLCNNLKELIVHSNPTIINQCIQQVFAKFLQLETLHLDYNFSSYEPYRISIIISRHQLKSLGLSVSGDPEAIEINAPNLKSYRFSSKTVPSSLLMNASSLQEAIFELHMEDIFDIDTEWFLNLLKYLMMFKNHKFLCLTIFSNASVTFNPLEWRGRYGSELPVIENLILRMTSSKENYEALLNGLLWCCHPKTLSVPLENERNRELLKFLYKAFTKEEDSFRRSSHCNWRHHLKDVKIVGLEVVDEKGLESLLTFEGYKLVTFELTWGAEDKGLESLLTFEGYN